MSGSVAPGGSVLGGRNGSAPIGAHSRSRLPALLPVVGSFEETTGRRRNRPQVAGRSNKVEILFSDDELARLKFHADRMGLSLTAFLCGAAEGICTQIERAVSTSSGQAE